MLNGKQTKWIIRAKDEVKLTNGEIAAAQGISNSRVQQLYGEYRRNEKAPELRKAGRPKEAIKEDESNTIIDLYMKYRIDASYIGVVLRKTGLYLDNNKVQRLLKEARLAVSEPRKWHRKKCIRYKRDH